MRRTAKYLREQADDVIRAQALRRCLESLDGPEATARPIGRGAATLRPASSDRRGVGECRLRGHGRWPNCRCLQAVKRYECVPATDASLHFSSVEQ